MDSYWKTLAVTATASATLLAVANISAAQDKPPVKIGFVTELTGPWSFFGTSCVAGLKFGEEQINSPGKRKIEFVITDNQTSPAQSVAASRSLDVQDKVLALSGPTSSDTGLAVYGYAEQNKVPFVVPVAAFPAAALVSWAAVAEGWAAIPRRAAARSAAAACSTSSRSA